MVYDLAYGGTLQAQDVCLTSSPAVNADRFSLEAPSHGDGGHLSVMWAGGHWETCVDCMPDGGECLGAGT